MTFFHKDAQLEPLGDRILDSTFAQFPELARNQLALTWIVYDPPIFVNTGGAIAPEDFWQRPVRGYAYRGVENVYPASVVKLFYLVAAHEWLERGMIPPSAELDRALRDMIVDSSNDATGYVVDVLTGTTGGPEIPDAPFETWKSQRNIVNRYFQGLGWEELATVNINQKTWCDGPYGRERAFYGETFENRNLLTTNATARLLHSIIGGVAVSPTRSRQMMELMQRSLNPADLQANPENQVTGFVGAGVPPQSGVWSKAGLTSQVRHDAAYIQPPATNPYLLIVFVEGKAHSNNEEILPFLSLQILEAMKPL
ncbi:serine hydrolase [Myxacorys almedinensis]|uniref:Serine hydrolase n=1 Tax=Myxacorys almedinensis A TaxID=2690445 RepID=A0A8J8CGM0_9CYAN|nr:serine hydrolase [Myxacorys almedinensis]NDJ15888.1 serine hydrolase [Myxacorys almedinensis A]